MASSSKHNSTDSSLSKSSESETDGMTLKDLKMAVIARADTNKDSKEGMAGQDNKEIDQQKGVVDQDNEKGMTDENSEEEMSNQESEEGDSNEATSESDAASDSENVTLADLKAVKDQEAEDLWYGASSEDVTYSVYHDGSEPMTGDEDICLSAWSNDSYGLKGGGSFDEDDDSLDDDSLDDSVIPFCGNNFKKGEPIQV